MKLVLVSRDLLFENSDQRVTHRSQAQINQESICSVARLSSSGYKVILLTHQPGISRGLLDIEELEAIHSKITVAAEDQGGHIEAIFYCPHDQQDRCHCRPPATGLLDVIEMEYDCNGTEATFFYQSSDELEMIKHKGCVGIQCDFSDAFVLASKLFIEEVS